MHLPSFSKKGLRFDDFFGPFETTITQFVDDFFGNEFLDGFKSARFPRLNAVIRDGHWVVEAGVSGVKAEDLDVEVSPEKILTIKGHMSKEDTDKKDEYFVRELSSKSFSRQIRLPEMIEGDPDAVLKNGLLTLKWKMPETVEEKPTTKKVIIKHGPSV